MELLGKIKIHELAKEIGMSSKDVLEKAKSLGIDVTSHLSNVTDEQATEIRNAYSKNNKNNVKKENKVENKKETKKETKKDNKKDTPVIIRREVILNDEEDSKKDNKKAEERKDVGFVKRRNNNDYNIVYRNKPNKPLTLILPLHLLIGNNNYYQLNSILQLCKEIIIEILIIL